MSETANTALQTNTPGCHGPCLLRAARPLVWASFVRTERGQGPRQPGVSLSLGSFGQPRSMRFFSLLLMLMTVLSGYAQEGRQRLYSTVFDLWNESVKEQFYAGCSIIRGNPTLLAELRQRAPDNLPFLREQVPNYFFACEIMDRVALGLPQRTSDASERYVPIARYDAAGASHRSERAGGLLLFHDIRSVLHIPDSADSVTLSVAASKASKARRLIKQAVQRGEFSISLVADVKGTQ